MVNIIGGATLSAAVTADKAQEPHKNAALDEGADADRGASVAAHLALPGFNPAAAPVDDAAAVQPADAVASVKAAAEKKAADAVQTAIKQFDEGLKHLTDRPETQIAQALGFNHETDPNLPRPDPIPGVNENGMLELSKEDQAADVNKDGKVSEEERRRYEMPLTYRSVEAEQHNIDAMADGPSAFSLAEANRAYGAATPPRPS
jgi:hypothetical protein